MWQTSPRDLANDGTPRAILGCDCYHCMRGWQAAIPPPPPPVIMAAMFCEIALLDYKRGASFRCLSAHGTRPSIRGDCATYRGSCGWEPAPPWGAPTCTGMRGQRPESWRTSAHAREGALQRSRPAAQHHQTPSSCRPVKEPRFGILSAGSFRPLPPSLLTASGDRVSAFLRNADESRGLPCHLPDGSEIFLADLHTFQSPPPSV